jgi:hypothetical protein
MTFYVYADDKEIPTVTDVAVGDDPEADVADLARQYPQCIYFEVLPERHESVVLVAFQVEHFDRKTAQSVLLPKLQSVLKSRDNTSPVECWWVAEDVREDGSDNDSAVFVRPGAAHSAGLLLVEHGLTESYNVPLDARNDQFEAPEARDIPAWSHFAALFRAVAACEPPEGSQLAEVLDEFQSTYEEAVR